MPLTVDTEPSNEPLLLADVKDHLNLDGTSRFDTYLELLITAIIGPAQDALGQQFIKATRVWTIKEFTQKVKMPRPPLIDITKVEYRDEDGNWQTVDSSKYEINSDAKPGFIRFNNDYDVPTTYENEEYPWRFTYDCGYQGDDGEGGTQSTYEEVPPEIRLWMKNLIGSYFMQREADVISYESVDVKALEKQMGRLIGRQNYNRSFG